MQFNMDPKRFALDWASGDAFIPVNKYTAHKLGGLQEAALLSETLSQYKRWASQGKLNEHDEFYWTVEDCLEQTTLTRDQQQRIFKSLEKHKLLKRTKRQIKEGDPKTARFIKIYFENIPPVLFDDPEDSALRQAKAAARKEKTKVWNAKRKLRKLEFSESGKAAFPTAPSESGKAAIGESGKPVIGESGKAATSNKKGFSNKSFNDLYKGSDNLNLIDMSQEEYEQWHAAQTQKTTPTPPPFYNWLEE